MKKFYKTRLKKLSKNYKCEYSHILKELIMIYLQLLRKLKIKKVPDYLKNR